jgi:hypothetical protein
MVTANIVKGLFAAAILALSTKATQVDQPPCASYTAFQYTGCYIDDRSDRSLPFGSGLDFGSMTIEKCTGACKVGLADNRVSFNTVDVQL